VKRTEAFHCRRNVTIENNKMKNKKNPTGTKEEIFCKQNERYPTNIIPT
jgi:hypothetical protein